MTAIFQKNARYVDVLLILLKRMRFVLNVGSHYYFKI